MRKLKLEVQTSVDGFIADTEGRTNWAVWNWTDNWNWDNELRQYHIDLTTSSDCILLSRKMAEEGFIDHWEKMAENLTNPQYAFAKPVAEMQKLVFSKTLEKANWKNAELIKGDFVNEIRRLKSMDGKDLIVYGGATFVSSLIKAGLIDEFHLFVNPIALGNGKTIFKILDSTLNLNLENCKSYGCGVVVLKYVKKND